VVRWWQAVIVVLPVVMAAGPAGAQQLDSYRRDRATELTTLGARFLEAGDRVSAAGYFRDAVSADPAYRDAYERLGELQLDRGAARDAEATFRVGIIRAGSSARLFIGLARALTAMGAHDDADAVLAQADAQLRDDRALIAYRAENAEQRGRWSLALALTRRLATLAGADRDAEREQALRARARALAVLVGGLDPVRSAGEGASPVRAALAGR